MNQPDPNILGSATITALMDVLRAAPYRLPVPSASDFPDGSAARVLWGLPITVTAGEEEGRYTAVCDRPWSLVDQLAGKAEVLLDLLGATGGLVSWRADRRPHVGRSARPNPPARTRARHPRR